MRIQALADDQIAAASIDALRAAYKELRAKHLRSLIDGTALRRQLEALLASASPNERDHPMMFEQWRLARQLLDGEE